jgi:hypothetical protein
MTNAATDLVRLSVSRTGNTREGYGIYHFDAMPVAVPPVDTTPWRCATCRWWEVIPEFAIDPSGRHGMCLLAELQDPPEGEADSHPPLKRFLADDGMATAADFGCVEWQTAFVPSTEPWLQGAGDNDWCFPGVATTVRQPVRYPDGGSRAGGAVTTYTAPPTRIDGAAPSWTCDTCRWYVTSTAYATQMRGGSCSIVAKADLIPAGDDPCVFLKAFAGEDGLDTAGDFGCAMWNDGQYAGLPERCWSPE